MMNKRHLSASTSPDELRPYNIFIIKGYIEFIQKNYPQVDIDQLLSHAGISRQQLDDSRFWFSQEQADHFYAKAQELTGNQNLAREAGHHSVLANTSPIYQYIAGFLGLSAVYDTVQLVSSKISHGAELSARKIGPQLVELISVPSPGIQEKPYQCENRMGVLEALGKIFSGKLSTIEHPECIHRGDSSCRYLISWEESPALIWQRLRNYSVVLGGVVLAAMPFWFPLAALLPAALALGCLILGCNWWGERLENIENRKNIEHTGHTAGLLLEEINSRSNDAMLMKEIGLASSSTLDVRVLLETITPLLQKRLNFDRGGVLLMDAHGTSLHYCAGFGYHHHLERLFKKATIDMQNISWAAPLAWAIKSRSPYTINDINEILPHMAYHHVRHIKRLGVRAMLCVPILFENKIMGLVVMERISTPGPISQNEVSLLVGIAQQIGISINNAHSYQRLRQSEERYRELVESANSFILRIDMQGRLTFYNKYAQQFLDFPEAKTRGPDSCPALPLPDNPLRGAIQQWLKGIRQDPEKFVNTQTEMILKDERRVWVAWTNRPIRDEQCNIVEILCIGNDITDLKRIEQEKIKLEVDLQRAQKMEALGTLAGGVAHDLNNILSSVVTYPDLLLLKLAPDDPLAKPLESIRTAGGKAAAIVQDLLTMARRGVSISKVVNLNDIINNYLTSVEFEALVGHHPQIMIKTELEAPLLNILGSDVHLCKSIMNLVTNAAEAMPEGGAITISTQCVYVDKSMPGYGNIVEGEYVLLRVADTGIGIAPRDLPHVFEPFYTKKVMGRSGTGLGMAVIWGTVKDHNGYIDIRSTVGKGTTIDIYLPVTRRALADDKAGLDLDSLRGSETILVVDDIAEQREIAQALLSELGYQVATAPSGEEAVVYMQTHDASLLMLDMIMDPGMDGLETYQRILDFKPRQKAIIVSGFSETDKVKQALRLGAGAYVKKPYLLGKIGRVVRDELDRGLATDRNYTGKVIDMQEQRFKKK